VTTAATQLASGSLLLSSSVHVVPTRAFDVAKLNILNVTHEFICKNIPWFEDDIQAKTELCTYLSSAGDLRATPHLADFWFAAAQQFSKLSVIALACLSVPCNSVAAE